MPQRFLGLLRQEGGWTRLTTSLAVAIALGAGLTATNVIVNDGGGGATPGTANIWVDTSGGTCADSSSLISYPNNGTECGSLDAAVQAAEPGDTIGWHNGTYSSAQEIQPKASLRNLSPGCDPYGQWGSASSVNCVRIVPDGTVTVNNVLRVLASSIWIDGDATGTISNPEGRSYTIHAQLLDTEAVSESTYPEHVIAEGLDTTLVGTFSATHVNFRDIDAGPGVVNTTSCLIPGNADGFENGVAYGSGIATPMNNIVWERMYIHDQNRGTVGRDVDCHIGGMFLKCTTGFTLRDSVFSQNAVYNIQLQAVGSCPAQPSNVTIENTWFGCPVNWTYDPGPGDTVCGGQADIQFNASASFANILIRYNSLSGGISDSGIGASYSNTRFVGNAGSVPSSNPCGSSGTTFGYNVWVGGTCGATDQTESSLSALFVSTSVGSENLHLLNGSNAANNFVTPTTSDYSLTEDIDAESRNAGLRDAGADER